MKKLFLLLFVAVAIISCNNSTNKTTETIQTIDSITNNTSKTNTDFELSCDGAGKILLTSSVEEIENIVGKQNLQYDSVFAEGEFAVMQLIAFKDKPEELIFFSQEESEIPFKYISSIRIQQLKSPYSFANGIKIGTKMEDLEKLNGGVPISFSGFEWDYEGGFLSFNKGKLSAEMPCFSGSFYHQVTKNGVNNVIGDGEFKSNQAAVKKIGVYVSEITISNRH